MSDFIPKHTPEEKALHAKSKVAMDKAMDAIAKARDEWTDRIMQAIMPDALYNMAKTNNGNERLKVQRWMGANKIRFKCWPDRTDIVRGDEILGRFIATFKDGKLAVEATIKKGLLPVTAEAQPPNSAQDNPSVVPPDSDASTGPADKGGAS